MDILIARTEDEIVGSYRRLAGAAALGCDTETSGLGARTARIFSIQFSDGEFSVLVPLSEGVELGQLARLLESVDVVKIFHNAKFDLEFLAAAGHGVLFTTHDPNHARRAADRAYLLRAGVRIAEGAVRSVLTRRQLEALYGAPVETLTDTATGAAAFLPG